MTAPTVLIETADGDEEVALPCTWAICRHCRGNGTSSAYLGAITQCDREPGGDWEDPDDVRDYFAGKYDRPCETCDGSGKVQVIDRAACEPDLLKAYDEQQRDEREMRAIEAAERRMGA